MLRGRAEVMASERFCHLGLTQRPTLATRLQSGVSASTVFYQLVDFYTSKEIQVLRHRRLTLGNALVLVAILREQMMKFQWGNGASIARLQATRIMVPIVTNVDGSVMPDWDGMGRLGAELLDSVIAHTAPARLVVPTTTPSRSFDSRLFDSMHSFDSTEDLSASE